MISFDEIVLDNSIPIYQQILMHIKHGIISGTIKDKDELPSRRTLSSLLGVNPNTIQKAYHILEEEDLIESHAGSKSYMKLNEEKILKIREKLMSDILNNIISTLKRMGLSKEESLELISQNWNKNTEGDLYDEIFLNIRIDRKGLIF